MATPFYTIEVVADATVLVLKGHPRTSGRPLVVMSVPTPKAKASTIAKMEEHGRKMAKKNGFDYK